MSLSFWSFGALDCIKVLHPAFILLSFFFFFLWVVYVRGRHYFLFLFLVSHCATLAIDLYL